MMQSDERLEVAREKLTQKNRKGLSGGVRSMRILPPKNKEDQIHKGKS